METFHFGISIITAAITVGAALGYFARVRMPRPPDVPGPADVLMIALAIVLIPYLYLGLPRWVLGTALAVGAAGLVALVLEPLLRPAWLAWTCAALLAGLDLMLASRFGTQALPFLVLNNALLLAGVVGVANLLAQAGLSARNLSILAGMLWAYDVSIAGALPLTSGLITRVAELPLGPIVRWPLGKDAWAAIGLGDLVMLAVAPPVFWKSYGRTAGIVAAGTSIAAAPGALDRCRRWAR